MTARCVVCGTATSRVLVDFGPQPPSNRYLRPNERELDRRELRVGQCQRCGLIQLSDPMPSAMVRSHFSWLTYNEPESHLDALVERLVALPGFTKQSNVFGLTYKDDSTLQRFSRRGYERTKRFDAADDFGIDDSLASLETIQEVVATDNLAKLSDKHGLADVLLVRHILEHAHDPRKFLAGAMRLVRAGGHAVFEMPDSRKFLEALDYSFIWEEHITYFTPDCLHNFMCEAGVDEVSVFSYPYLFEDSLTAIVRKPADGVQVRLQSRHPIEHELNRGNRFGDEYAPTKAAIHDALASLQSSGKRIAIFGAGHLAAKFVNLFDVSKWIDCVIDDHPGKRGLTMPGSRLPIHGSEALSDVNVCLLALSPESEKKVVAAKQAFIAGGGVFQSIFALSPMSFSRTIR